MHHYGPSTSRIEAKLTRPMTNEADMDGRAGDRAGTAGAEAAAAMFLASSSRAAVADLVPGSAAASAAARCWAARLSQEEEEDCDLHCCGSERSGIPSRLQRHGACGKGRDLK